MWNYLSGSDGLSPIVLYDYQLRWGGRYPQEFLEVFSGILQCDGYQGYTIYWMEDVRYPAILQSDGQKAMPSEERHFYSIHLLQAHRPVL